VDSYLEEARRRSAEYLYARARQWSEAAEDGDRLAAREAYDALRRTEQYFPDLFRDRQTLLLRARELGTTHIAVALHNETPTLLPAGFEREMLGFNLRDLDSRWQQYHLQPEPGLEYDYRLDIRLTHIEVSPSLVREREFEQKREIEDGFDYVLGENGNVMKDSLGNDIKVPRKITIRARVLETYQHKAGRVHARIEVIDTHNRRLIDSRPVTAEAIFENRAGAFRGDERALDKEARRLIRQQPLSFPTDADLLFDAAAHLRPELKRTIDRLGRLMG
jgi:hypothetical protein